MLIKGDLCLHCLERLLILFSFLSFDHKGHLPISLGSMPSGSPFGIVVEVVELVLPRDKHCTSD